MNWTEQDVAAYMEVFLAKARKAKAKVDAAVSAADPQPVKRPRWSRSELNQLIDRRRYTRANGGRRADLGDMYFRSAWEANYARYLNFLQQYGDIFKWEYEPDTFYFEPVKRGIRSYTPDFKIWRTEDSLPHYEELKGWFDPRSKTKLNRMAKYHPEIKIILVQEAQYRAIAKGVKRLLPNWEGK